MKFSNKTKIGLFALLVVLNVIMRFQAISREIGADSFVMHIMTNSLSEYGYARWFLHPLSLFGLYPYSYTSSMQFLLSGIHQSTGLDMDLVVFFYCIFLGFLSMLTAYLMAGAIIDDDIFKFLVAFGFSTTPAILGYTTWTIPTRGLFIILAPLLVYSLLKCRTSIRFIPLVFLLAVFLFATHHLFYFLLPSFFVFFLLIVWFKIKEHIDFIKIPERFAPLVPLTCFLLMFSIPFFTGKFIEHSRYSPVYISYGRYIGMLIIPVVGGLVYMMFKPDKSFREWFLLLTVIFLTTMIYEQTYMKWFLPIFLIPFACIGLVNILRSERRRRYALAIVTISLLLSISFSGFYQFLHFQPTHGMNERYMDDSTYIAGTWVKEYVIGTGVSNDKLFGFRIAAVSETTHHLTASTLSGIAYGFISSNISQFKFYPTTSEDFWFNVGVYERDWGEYNWVYLHKMGIKPHKFNITHFVENTKAQGNVIWNHASFTSKLLHHAYEEKGCVYDCGKARVWDLR